MAGIARSRNPSAAGAKAAPRWLALLRGINVGRGPRLAMGDWRVLLEGLGFANVRTLLTSGNVVFTGVGRAADIAGRIQRALAEQRGLRLQVIVKSADEVAAIVAGNRLDPLLARGGDASRLLVAVAADSTTLQALADLEASVRPPDRWWLGDQALYLWCPEGVHASHAASVLLGRRGAALTTRNWATWVKIAALFGSSEPAPAIAAGPRP